MRNATRNLPHYEMFSYAGDRAVHRIVEAARKQIADRKPLVEIVLDIRSRMERVERRHPEVFDTAVRDRIYHALLESVKDTYGPDWKASPGGHDLYFL